MLLRDFARRFIGDKLADNIRDEDLLEVVENSLSYINSEILIPIEYIDLYKNNKYLEDILESDINVITKIYLLNEQQKTSYFMYLWASYKLHHSFKSNIYNKHHYYDGIETRYRTDIQSEDYSISIKFLASQEYLNDIIDEYCKKKQYKDLMLILKDSCANKIYNEILKILSTTIEVVKYRRTLVYNDGLSFLITLSELCNMGEEIIKFDNLTLTLKQWICIINIDMSLLPSFMKNLHELYI